MRYLAVSLICGLALAGLVQPEDPIPDPGQPGAPHRTLSLAEQDQFLRGRLLFDKDFLVGAGVGPVFNADSCRACHQDPVVGGAGGIDVQVQRPKIDVAGNLVSPVETGDLAQTHSIPGTPREEIPANVVFVEERNAPSLLGLGLVDLIAAQAIVANQDPNDTSPTDGIQGIAHILPGTIVGRFGWKANVPDLRSFVRDALGNEMGITVPITGNTFGFTANDLDAAVEPELKQDELDDIVFFLQMLDFAPKRPATAQTQQGGQVFNIIGCAKCHIPILDGVELYSNLLLHNVHLSTFVGVTQGDATSGLYRTPPLRGLRDTAPYFHDGRSETIDAAIRRHDGEALGVRQTYENTLSDAERAALIAFLESL